MSWAFRVKTIPQKSPNTQEVLGLSDQLGLGFISPISFRQLSALHRHTYQ